MNILSSKNMVGLINRTLSYVDTRLMNHGERVGYLMYSIAKYGNLFPKNNILDFAMLGLLHDVGAYKTEDIDKMVEFESNDVWRHSIYGYLFLKHLSPLKNHALALLFHHTDYN